MYKLLKKHESSVVEYQTLVRNTKLTITQQLFWWFQHNFNLLGYRMTYWIMCTFPIDACGKSNLYFVLCIQIRFAGTVHFNKHSCKYARLAIIANSQQLQVITKLQSLGRFYKHLQLFI